MNCIIIDDENFARDVLATLIFKTPDIVLVDEFTNAIDAIKYLNSGNEVDFIFLDIHMPNFSGIDFIQTIKNPPQIILVTSDKNFAAEAFNYDCVTDYLLKPITEERFERAVKRTVNKIKTKPNLTPKYINPLDLTIKEIYVNIDKKLIKIDIMSINSIQANGDYIIIKTENKNIIVHTTLKKIEGSLPKSIFLQIHRSHIINTNKIIDIKDSTVLIGKELIPLSKGYRSELLQRLNML